MTKQMPSSNVFSTAVALFWGTDTDTGSGVCCILVPGLLSLLGGLLPQLSYCNALKAGLSLKAIQKLLIVQNTAA